MNPDPTFKAIGDGIGFYEERPPGAYDEDPESSLFSSNEALFEGLDQSPKLYDQLLERLEDPVLKSFHKMMEAPHPKPASSTENILNPKERKRVQAPSPFEERSALGKRMLPVSGVWKLDLCFSLGLSLLTCIAIGLFFGSPALPPLFICTFVFGLFHQAYLMISRSFMGCSLGEERYNISWNKKSPLLFIARGLLICLTGFILIPICSAVLKKDILGELTGLQPLYNI